MGQKIESLLTLFLCRGLCIFPGDAVYFRSQIPDCFAAPVILRCRSR